MCDRLINQIKCGRAAAAASRARGASSGTQPQEHPRTQHIPLAGPRPCRALILTTPSSRSLLPLLLPSAPPNDDEATNAGTAAAGGCTLYRAATNGGKEQGEEWDADAVVVCACDVEVPVEVRPPSLSLPLICVSRLSAPGGGYLSL